jgi:hypothetical protein
MNELIAVQAAAELIRKVFPWVWPARSRRGTNGPQATGSSAPFPPSWSRPGGVVAILPAGSLSHTRFAAEGANCEGAFLKPTLGWIAGCI